MTRPSAGVQALLRQVQFVLVRPQISGNMGSVARVLNNFGFTRLVIVEPAPAIDGEASKMALRGLPLLKKARRVPDLVSGVAQEHVVMGTTRRLGHRKRHHHLTPSQACSMVRDVAASARVSILFGPEDAGLSNADLALCHWLVTIPSPSRENSMNLSHAVAVIAYELSRQFSTDRIQPPSAAVEMESFFEHLRTVLTQVGFLKETDPHRMMMKFRHVFHRAGLDRQEVATFRGVLSQIQWALGKPKGVEREVVKS